MILNAINNLLQIALLHIIGLFQVTYLLGGGILLGFLLYKVTKDKKSRWTVK